jgi:hypothetical protein
MPIPANVYRGDSRDHNEIHASNGFSAWSPLTIPEAKEMIELFTKARTLQTCSFLTKVQRGMLIVPPAVSNPPTSLHTPDSLKELIIRSGRSRSTFWISTEITQGGGGMGGGYLYEIPTGNLRLVPWASVNSQLCPMRLWPELYTDTGSLANASVIALYNASGSIKELSYLTSIARSQISGWKMAAALNAAFTPTNW